MLRVSTLAIAASLVTSTAFAAGIERNAPSTRILFEEGRYLEFSFGYVSPDLEGTAGPGAPTGNLFESYTQLGFAYKADLTDRLSYAIVPEAPWGVDTAYPGGAPYTGVTATLDSLGLQAIVSYDVSDQFKVYAGLRAQQLSAEANIPFVGGYSITTDKQMGYGYMVGAAYQIPDIAARVAVTYYSSIEHTLNTTEFGALAGQTDIETPQSVNVEFQTGIAENTLLFGSVRWVDWSEFAIAPPNYPLGTLVDYEKDWITYTVGVGRQFTDSLSGFVTASYEPASNTILTTLGPVDGRASIGIGASYDVGQMTITGAVNYVMLGEAQNALGTTFSDGSALAAGIRIGYSF